jgi:uncharacterized protein
MSLRCFPLLSVIVLLGCQPASRDFADALVDAARVGDVDRVRELLNSGAPLEGRQSGYTPLLTASSNLKADVVKLLLDAGADVNATTPLGESALFPPSRRGRVDIVRDLLEAGANPNIQDESGMTALMIAAAQGQGVVRLLLESGASPKVVDKDGWSPLMWAAAHGDLEIVKTLVAAGSELNQQNNKGETASTIATRLGHNNVTEVLEQQPPDSNEK